MAGSVRFVTFIASVISKTPLYVCTIPQQHFGTSLLYDQDHTAEVLGEKLGLGLVEVSE